MAHDIVVGVDVGIATTFVNPDVVARLLEGNAEGNYNSICGDGFVST